MQRESSSQSKLHAKLSELSGLFNPQHVLLEQLQPLLKSANSSLISNAVIALIVYAVMGSTGAQVFVLPWVVTCLLVIACSAVGVAIVRKKFNNTEGFKTAIKFLIAASALRGGVWGFGFYLMMPDANNYEQIMLGWLIAGLMCGGAFSTWSLPIAAVAFSGLAAFGGFLGMSAVPGVGDTWMPYAVPVLFVFLTRAIIESATVLRQSIMAEREVVEKSQVIGLLLRDFEVNSSDWLWETDKNGFITRGAERFSRILELSEAEINAKNFTGIFETFATTQEENALLSAKFKVTDAFSNHVIALTVQGMERFVKLSAGPFLNDKGVCTGWHGVASDITDERIADMKVRKLALFDTLTDLPNRAFFYDRLDDALAAPATGQCWIMYLDLDGFKSVNDTHGHAVGDQLLRAAAARLSNCLPAKGMLARLGGDEFSVICNGSKERISEYAQHILTATDTTFQLGKNEVKIGVSIGIAPVIGENLNRDELMRRADVALYAAKHQGKGVARYYDQELDRQQLRRRDIETALRSALELGQFKVHYQPIVEIQSGKTHSYEALLRLETPELGRVNPDEFIPVAEDSGMITEIGNWVIQTACMDAARWPNDICVAVNISPLQLKSHKILTVVTLALAHAKLPASRLELELTESALVENVEQTTRVLADLKALGVRLALDDFGTGYSSLSHLHQFNFDKIKIDKSFVQSFGERRESTAVVNAVALLARDLGILMTAEGVETVAHMNSMREVGCDQVQGYLLGRPQAIPAHTEEEKKQA